MALAVVLAIVAALSIGAGDFLGGVVVRRDASTSALGVAYLAVLVVSLPVAAAVEGWPDAGGLGWGAGMGVLWVIGTFSLVRGIAYGRIVVVIPIAGILSAVIPVAADLIAGERPGSLVAAGVAVGLAAIGFVGIGHREEGGRSVAWSAAQAAVGGVSTGVALVLMEQAAESGLWPLASVGLVSAILMAVVLRLAGWLRRPPSAAILPAVAMGALVAGSFVAMMLAFPRGSLTIVAVVVAQYPAVTMILAALIWKQRPRGIQYLGVMLSLVAVALIAAGA